MKKIFAFLILAVFLAGPVLAADEGAKPDAPKAEGEEGAKDKKPKDVTGGRFSGDPIFVHLDPMVLPIITNDGAEQLVTLQIALQVRNMDVADNVHTNMPRVRDALMRALYGGLGSGGLRDGQLVDVSRIKTRATDALAEVFPDGGVQDVLIEAVAQRRL